MRNGKRLAAPILALLAASTLAGGAGAQQASVSSEQVREDVRCLIAYGAVRSTADKDRSSAAMQAALYYFGRIDGAGAGDRLGDLVVAEAARLKTEELPGLITSCNGRLSPRVKELEAAGGRVRTSQAQSPKG